MSDELTTRGEVTKRGYLQLSVGAARGLLGGSRTDGTTSKEPTHRDVWYDSYVLGERKKER